MTHPLYTCLWFDGNAKEAALFYCSVFNNSRITADSSMVVHFELEDVKMMALNGGPHFKFSPAISFFVTTETAEETDALFNKLSDGGDVLMPLDKYDWSEKYGWCQDKFGLSWQVFTAKPGQSIQKINPMLMFVNEQAGKAAQAIEFYIDIFPESSVGDVIHYDEGEGAPTNYIKHGQFFLGNYKMMVMDNGSPTPFNFNESISMVVNCDTQEDINHYWDKLSGGGSEGRCGWLKDQFGVSWQIVPSVLGELMTDPAKAGKTMEAYMKMKKFDIAELVRAAES
jgi:predicted 3-demethylubiquinone-9 3-methyltransferase (glyoxalase superfamily)